MNKRPFKWAADVLILALIGAVMLCSCSFFGKENETSSSSKEESATASAEASETTAVTETETSSEISSLTSETDTDSETETESEKKKTTASKAASSASAKETTTSTSASETDTPSSASETSRRASITDIFTTVSRTTATTATTKATTKATTAAYVTKEDGSIDLSCFDDAAFVGNSRLLAAGNYGLAKNVYAKVGLNVNTVFTDSCEGGSGPVIDELDGKSFRRVFLMFGDNECGWGSMSAFVKQYTKVINTVKEKQPNAKIYVISVLPISKEKSAKNEYGYSKKSIDNINGYIKDMAKDLGVTYIDAASSLADKEGYLPDEASTDGCHMGKKYTKIWLEYTARHM